jgi:glutathione S-transferase
LQNALAYIASEVHPSFHDLYEDSYPADCQALFVERAVKRLKYIDSAFVKGKRFLVNDSLSVADIYLYIVLSWLPTAKQIQFDDYPTAKAFYERIAALPEIVEATARMNSKPSTTC